MANLLHQSFHIDSQHGRLHMDANGHSFNGSSDFVALPSRWGGHGWSEVTVEAWIRPTANTGDFQAIVSPADTSFVHFQLHNEGVGNCAVFTDNGAVVLPVIPVEPLNRWRHVAIIAKSGETKLLIDGVQYGNANTTEFSFVTASDAVFIGKGHAGGRHFQGDIGDVHIFQDAREHGHVHGQLYQYLTDKPSTDPIPGPVDPTPATTTFGYKSWHGQYMSAQPDGRMEANRDWLRGWEIFTVEDAGDGKVGLKSFHGKYLSAQPDGTLQCNRDWLRGWEMFTREESNGRVGFKSFHGKYISAQPDGTLQCNRDWLRGWELFTEEPVEG